MLSLWDKRHVVFFPCCVFSSEDNFTFSVSSLVLALYVSSEQEREETVELFCTEESRNNDARMMCVHSSLAIRVARKESVWLKD